MYRGHFITEPPRITSENIDPCNPTPCGSNAFCQQRNRAAACQCIEEMYGDPYVACRPECVVNSDCPSNKACQRNKCIDPCPGLCGINARCNIRNHIPVCICLEGYIGDPFTACKLKPLRKYSIILKISCVSMCMFTAIEQVVEEDPCDPNPCGPYSSPPRSRGGRCDCSCLPEMIGSAPNCHPECVLNADCPRDRACVNQKCVDPCPGVCGQNSHCKVRNHYLLCVCDRGFVGDPFTRCYKEISK